MNQGEIGTVVVRIVKNIDKDFSAEFNAQLQAIFPFCCHRDNRLGEKRCDISPNLDFKSVEFLFRVH